MNDESDLVLPPAQAPPIAPNLSETPKAAAWRDDHSQSAIPDRHAHIEDSRVPEFSPKVAPLTASNSARTLPAKTGSLLSQISAMVSEEGGVPYSQNPIRRSTPSTARRMRPAFSTKRSRAPVQIQEESHTSRSNRLTDSQGDDLDLYADGDGVVKDLCDEMGKPLRLAEARVPSPVSQHEPVDSGAANVEPSRESQDGGQPRYSTERPMSFIAGSTDQHGRPQDQINQPTTLDELRIRRHENDVEQRHPPQQGTIYSELSTDPLDPLWDPVQSAHTPDMPPPKNDLWAIKSLDSMQPAKHAFIKQVHPSGEANARELLSHTQNIHGQSLQNSHVSNLALHQPQAQRVSQIPQIIPESPEQPTFESASEYQHARHSSENQLELHQQKQQPTTSSQSSIHDTQKAHGRSSSKTKTSKFKIFGNSKTVPQPQSSENSATTDSSLPADKQEHSKFFTSKKRHSSDQTSQASQKSFFDLRKHKDSAALYSIPYQQFQSTSNIQSPSGQSSLPAATGQGKTKRFSGLGAIFGRDGPSADRPVAKSQLSSPREEKKLSNTQNPSARGQSHREGDPANDLYNPLQDQTSHPLQLLGQSVSETRLEESSAFLSTKRLAEEHQTRKKSQHIPQATNRPSHATSLVHRQTDRFDPMRRMPSDHPREYYNPSAEEAGEERGAYAATVIARQQHERIQAEHQREPVVHVQSYQRNPRYEQQQPQPLPISSIHQPWLGPNSTSRPDCDYNIQDAPSPEPRYEATPIPAAYSHVSGAYVAPSAQQEQPVYSSQNGQISHALPSPVRIQASDSWGPLVSPPMSPRSQVRSSNFSYPDASTTHLVSPILPPAAPPNSFPHPSAQRGHRPRMNSIPEVQQQDRPWHLNLPAGATEQEIVRARQGQYMQDLFNAQQQQQAERAARSPSPRTFPQPQIQNTTTPHDHGAGGGFREILPTSSSQPYATPDSKPPYCEQPLPTRHHPVYEQQIPVRSASSPHPAAYPLPASRNSMRVTRTSDPPPREQHSPTVHAFHDTHMSQYSGQQQYQNPPPTDHAHQEPPGRAPRYNVQVPEEAPPSYDGIGVPNEGLNKSRPDAVRPPNISTDVNRQDPSQRPGSRPRQPSIGMLQHPQPASMAASPQRTLSDMGAESLRRQLLQQENLMQMERVQRERERHEALVRERQQREAARARARELERSVSSGGQVSSLHSVGGSFNSGGSASSSSWQRRGSHNNRQVFELSALEDDEPVMKATSYPGQEWVPPVWEV